MAVLGISAYYHDSAAAAVAADGTVLAAAQEERFSRRKNDSRFPANAVRFCLAAIEKRGETVERVAFYERPDLKLGRIAHSFARHPSADPQALATALANCARNSMAETLVRDLEAVAPGVPWRERLGFVEHHAAHAASAFYPSPFAEAAVLTVDGVGETATTVIAHGQGRTLRPLSTLDFPHSLGLVYSAFTHYLGFKVNSGEYKVMGLAPYGRPRYADTIRRHLLTVGADGALQVAERYFDGFIGTRPIVPEFCDLFGMPARHPGAALTRDHADIAASIQQVVEEALLAMARHARALTGARALCMAGGVALNCVANGRIARELGRDGIWVQPAAGDAGGALGAALFAVHAVDGIPRHADGASDTMSGALLGPRYDDESIAATLDEMGVAYHQLADEQAALSAAAHGLAAGEVVAWFQGAGEFGPRALGNRSILADPRRPDMQNRVNLTVKKREGFRPFAPAVLEEDAADWFDLDRPSPYMLLVAPVAPHRRITGARKAADQDAELAELRRQQRSEIPAVTHVDFSARVQTVGRTHNPLFHALLSRFRDLTGCPVLLNTSFNLRGEPVVGSPADAVRTFLNGEMDRLVIGRCQLLRTEQDPLSAAMHRLVTDDD